MLKKPAKLTKLAIKAFTDPERQSPAKESEGFVVMFNPESFKQKYSVNFAKEMGVNDGEGKVRYVRSDPGKLDLKLVIDGTGVAALGGELSRAEDKKSVKDQVDAFLDYTYRMNGDIHEPNYLTIMWGLLVFDCRLSSVDINYTLFARDGMPLRADLNAVFLADTGVKKKTALENKKSPDLTHVRVVKEGDTLPLLAKRMYGDASYYLQVAKVNGLNNFRRLRPGERLVFPPVGK